MTLDSPERGLLCLRVRDEIRMTIDAYKTLYDSSVTFGVKKQLQAEQGMAEMEEQVLPIPHLLLVGLDIIILHYCSIAYVHSKKHHTGEWEV